MLQNRYLELKSELAQQRGVLDATIESLERLFAENQIYVSCYVANMLLIQIRRATLGIENVGTKNANKILDLYVEVRDEKYQNDFDEFRKVFEGVIDFPGVKLVDFIFIKTHQCL